MNAPLPSRLAGMKIIANPLMTIPGPPITVARTWRERLLSRPWRPMQATRQQATVRPSPEIRKFGNAMVAHPATVEQLLLHIAEAGRERATGGAC